MYKFMNDIEPINWETTKANLDQIFWLLQVLFYFYGDNFFLENFFIP